MEDSNEHNKSDSNKRVLDNINVDNLENTNIIVKRRRKKRFDTNNKTSVVCLYEICALRGYGEPVFKELISDGNFVSVIVTIGNSKYGSGACVDFLSACELASMSTLQLWLGDDYMVSDRCKNAVKNAIDRVIENAVLQASMSDTEELEPKSNLSDCNASLLLHIFSTAVCPEIASKPTIEIISSSRLVFIAEASIVLSGQVFKAEGQGSSKMSAKRDACFNCLRYYK